MVLEIFVRNGKIFQLLCNKKQIFSLKKAAKELRLQIFWRAARSCDFIFLFPFQELQKFDFKNQIFILKFQELRFSKFDFKSQIFSAQNLKSCNLKKLQNPYIIYIESERENKIKSCDFPHGMNKMIFDKSKKFLYNIYRE